MKFLSPLLIAAALPFINANFDERELQQPQCNENDTAIMLNSSNPFLDPIGFLFDLDDCGGDFGSYFYNNDCFDEELLSFGLSTECAFCWRDFRSDANDCFSECRDPFFRDPFESCPSLSNTSGNSCSSI